MATGVITKEYRVVLVGKSGAGKSATGNSILAQTNPGAFESRNSAAPVTQRCQREQRYLVNHEALLTVIETPGLFDSQTPTEETVKEISKCIALACPGPHIFLFILRVGRFTEEERETLNILTKLFGENVHKYVIVAFTYKDDLDDDGITVEQFVHKGQSDLKEFLKQCENRYVGICNKPNDPSHEQTVEDVLELITQTIGRNKSKFYSESLVNSVEDRIEEEINTIHESDLTKTMDKIREELRNDIESMDVDSELEGLWGDINTLTLQRISCAFQGHIYESINA